MLRRTVSIVTGLLLILGPAAGAAAWAQATTTTTSSTSSGFDSLSPGNQKIARALYEAQQPATGSTTKPLTLDEIAAKKQGGQGWGKVFKDMKAQGLVQEKNLGQVVSRQHRSGNGHVVTDKHRYGKHDGKYEHSSSGRGHADASGTSGSGSSHSAAGRSGSGSGPGGRGGK